LGSIRHEVFWKGLASHYGGAYMIMVYGVLSFRKNIWEEKIFPFGSEKHALALLMDRQFG